MLHILSLLFWLVIIPYCIGLIPANFISADRRSPGFVLLSGYFFMWAVFEVSAIPMVIFAQYDNFKPAACLFMALSILCAAAGLWLVIRRRRADHAVDTGKGKIKSDAIVIYVKRMINRAVGCLQKMSWAERIEWLLFFFLLGFQLYKAAAYASFDGDDAYYVVESLIAQQADVMYRILPYTGGSTELDVRHALAVLPMWIAFIAVKSDIHATIVSHLVMPFVFIPLSYLAYFEIGKTLFGREAAMQEGGTDGLKDSMLHRENLPIFMIIMGLFQMFGNVSIYTNETFFLTRTWQGKAVAGSLVIPALFWMFLWIYNVGAEKRRVDAGLWVTLACINMTAGICSSISVFLVSILMAVTALCLAAVERDFKVIFKMGAVCIPNVIYMAGYGIMWYNFWLNK